MTAAVGIEPRALALDGAAGKDAPFGDEERSPFGLRVFGLDERRDELPGQVLGHIDREDDGLPVRFGAGRVRVLRVRGQHEGCGHGADEGRATNEG